MRLFLYKLFYNLAVWTFPCKTRGGLIEKYCAQQVDIYKREKDMEACARPKTYPKAVPKDVHLPTYTDFFER